MQEDHKLIERIIEAIKSQREEDKKNIKARQSPSVEFLTQIFKSNKNFRERHDVSFFAPFRDYQTPSTTVLGCCDSRVHLLSLSDCPQNDIFEIRNIGNQMCTSKGSVSFGVKVLETPILLILGHVGCGAVDAARTQLTTNIPEIDRELSTLKIGATNHMDAVIENVDTQVGHALDEYLDRVTDKTLTIFGMVYDFKKGGSLYLTNVNGLNCPYLLREAYKNIIPNIKFLER